jgi:hypothetical protein
LSDNHGSSAWRRGALARSAALVAAVAALLLLGAASARAATTIGQLDPAPGSSVACAGEFDGLNPTVTSGPSYVVPPYSGTITSWSTNTSVAPNQMLTMKVFRNVAGSTWMVVAHDGPRALVAGALNTFSGLNITVKPGDVLGLYYSLVAFNNCEFDVPGESYLERTGNLADGGSGTFSSDTDARMNISAVVKPSSTFTLVGAPRRNKKKGTAVIDVDLPGPGTVELSGPKVKTAGAAARTSATATGPGVVQLVVRAKGKAKKKLKTTGKAKVSVTLTYTPTGGDPSAQSLQLRLKKKR